MPWPKPTCICKSVRQPGGVHRNPACPLAGYTLGQRIAIAIADPEAVLPRRRAFDDDGQESMFSWSRSAVQSVIDMLAQHDPVALLGRPDGRRVEYAVFWHIGDPDLITPKPGLGGLRSCYQISHLTDAIRLAESNIGKFGFSWYTIEHREHYSYSNGVDLSTPWRRLLLPELVTKENY